MVEAFWSNIEAVAALFVVLGSMIAIARWLKACLFKEIHELRREMQEMKNDLRKEMQEFRKEIQIIRDDIKEIKTTLKSHSEQLHSLDKSVYGLERAFSAKGGCLFREDSNLKKAE